MSAAGAGLVLTQTAATGNTAGRRGQKKYYRREFSKTQTINTETTHTSQHKHMIECNCLKVRGQPASQNCNYQRVRVRGRTGREE